MKLKALVLGTAMLAGVAGSAQAALLSVHAGGTPYTTPSAGGSPSNDVNPDQVGWLGANLYLDGVAGTNYVITYTFIGQEAGFDNEFQVDGALEFTGNVTAINSWTQTGVPGRCFAARLLVHEPAWHGHERREPGERRQSGPELLRVVQPPGWTAGRRSGDR